MEGRGGMKRDKEGEMKGDIDIDGGGTKQRRLFAQDALILV